MGQIKWSEKAVGHLRTIHEFIARDSKTYSFRFLKALIKSTAKLEISPRCGRIVPEFEMHGFREVIYQNYRIVYRIRDDNERVEILAVIHSSRDFKTAFSREWELN